MHWRKFWKFIGLTALVVGAPVAMLVSIDTAIATLTLIATLVTLGHEVCGVDVTSLAPAMS